MYIDKAHYVSAGMIYSLVHTHKQIRPKKTKRVNRSPSKIKKWKTACEVHVRYHIRLRAECLRDAYTLNKHYPLLYKTGIMALDFFNDHDN